MTDRLDKMYDYFNVYLYDNNKFSYMKKLTWLSYSIIILLIVGGIYVALSPTTQVEKETAPIKIGVIQSLTGKNGTSGTRAKNGIYLAIKEVNENGGINGRELEPILEDGQTQSNSAVSAIQKLINVDSVSVVFGPSESSAALAAAPVAERNKVIMFAQIPSVPKLRDAGDYIFRNRITGEKHASLAAEFSYNQLNGRTASILYINLDNGLGYRDAFTSRFQELGGKILSTEAYSLEETENKTQLTKIKTNDPDILYIAGQNAEIAIKEARQLDLRAQIISINGTETPEVLEVAGSAAEGIYYTYSAFDPNSNDPVMQKYQKKYQAEYAEVGESFAANGYDALMLVADAFKECGTTAECVKDYLYQVKNYPGVGGTTTFDKDGEVSKDLIIKTVKNGEFVVWEK
jgi:branched-chain amino acid transport system substrate-binding protein